MSVSYINYSSFEQKVRLMVGIETYQRYRHLLPAVQLVFRERFLDTVVRGLDMPTAFDHTTISYKLPDNNFKRYINFVAAKELSL